MPNPHLLLLLPLLPLPFIPLPHGVSFDVIMGADEAESEVVVPEAAVGSQQPAKVVGVDAPM